jgi:hypothetical protein
MTARGTLPSVPAGTPGGACDREANAPAGEDGWAGMGADAATPADPVDVTSGQGEHLPAMICPLASVVSVIIIT